MKLAEYMSSRGLDDQAMALAIGDCGAHAVRKWKYGERLPRPHLIGRIQEVTHGVVTLKDFLENGSDAKHTLRVHKASKPRAIITPKRVSAQGTRRRRNGAKR